jgi:amidase
MLGVLEGRVDPNDAATSACARVPDNDYTRFLNPRALEGARIGVPRTSFYEGGDADSTSLMEEAVAILKQHGAVVVDPADLPSVLETDPQKSFLHWSICAGYDNAKGRDQNCSVVLKYGMKRDFTAWLASLGSAAPVPSLTALREFNLAHAAEGAIKYGQAQLDISDEMDVDADRARYEADRAKDVRLAGVEGIDAAITRDRLDALLFPSLAGYNIAARPGYPTVMVPFGFVPNAPTPPFPDGFAARPSPFGVSFTGTACSEPRLLAIAYAFEQATKRRVPPPLFP